MLPIKHVRKSHRRRQSNRGKAKKSAETSATIQAKILHNLDQRSVNSQATTATNQLPARANNQNRNQVKTAKKNSEPSESSSRKNGNKTSKDANNNSNKNANKSSNTSKNSSSKEKSKRLKASDKELQADTQTIISKHTVDSRGTTGTGKLDYDDSDSLTNTHRLKRDGYKTPQDYRNAIARLSSPSQVSVETCSHYYKIPSGKFHTADDVFRYRGYKKICKIDEGAFGVVSKAKRLFDGKMLAVKEVDLSKKRAKRIQEMRRELFVLQRVEHKHIVHLLEHFVIGNNLVIIMELCEGSNLTVHLKTCPLAESQAAFLFKQMALSIKVLHRKGIAHRDVKLNNFLLDAKRKLIKISDFGLSVVGWRKSKGLLTAHTYCGTEPYMAPEILRRNANNIRTYNPFYADLWSLGICLYAMLTQTFPFKVTTNHENLLRAQIGRSWKFPRALRASISEQLQDLVWHLLDPEPGRRITINDTLLHPWLNPQPNRQGASKQIALNNNNNNQIVLPANISSNH